MIDELVALFNQGKLTEAIEQANAGVAKDPRDLPLRLVLVQLVCFTGNWDRVEKIAQQLKTLDSQNEHMALTGMIDNLSIAELQRKAVWEEGMVPEFVQTPDDVTNRLLWAWSCRRSDDQAQYQETMAEVLDNAPRVRLMLDGQSHDGFRDLDDPTAIMFEAYTVQGNYLWIPHQIVQNMDVARPTRLVDHLWNKARMTLHDGTQLAVFLPGIYYHSIAGDVSDSLKLGRETEWNDEDIGRGRRVFGAGDEEFTLFDLAQASMEVVS